MPVSYTHLGFGLSYTEFSVVGTGISASGLGTDQPKISVTASVKNIGHTYAGKEVVEVYVSCPQNDMPKEFRRLAGFGKTALLSPDETQDLTITFPLYQLASYHEDKACLLYTSKRSRQGGGDSRGRSGAGEPGSIRRGHDAL